MQRVLYGNGCAEPLLRRQPCGMAEAIVVAERSDALREQLNAAGRRRKLVLHGISAELGEQRLGRMRRDFGDAIAPEKYLAMPREEFTEFVREKIAKANG